MTLTRAGLAAVCDHTLLRPEATAAQVRALCGEAVTLGVHAVCISPIHVPAAAGALGGAGIALCTVAGFPSGAHRAADKAAEAGGSVGLGAAEVDMVAGLALIADGRHDLLEREVAAVRAAVDAAAGRSGVVVKVILETALWTPVQIADACRACAAAGADMVKTSTGMHPAGGATVEAVATMAETGAPLGLGVKASGGIRTATDARRMLAAGATRLGTSATAAILAGLDGPSL
jgi:deoxyribose-phosphate aldolase